MDFISRTTPTDPTLLMPTFKKPSASSKRPAAAAGCINETIAKMAKGTTADRDDKEERAVDPDEEGGHSGRDKAKGQKYAKLKATRSSPRAPVTSRLLPSTAFLSERLMANLN